MVLQQHTSILCYRVRVQMYPVKQPTNPVASASIIVTATAQCSTVCTLLPNWALHFPEKSSLTWCHFCQSAPVLSGLKQIRTHSAVIDSRTAYLYLVMRDNANEATLSRTKACAISAVWVTTLWWSLSSVENKALIHAIVTLDANFITPLRGNLFITFS